MENSIQVGYSRQTVTPEEAIPLSGYSNERQRYMQNIKHEICATCVAITDAQDNTILMISVDLTRLVPYFAGESRRRVSLASGVPEERIFIAATHTHAGPGLPLEKEPCIQRYVEKFYQKLEIAAVEALADRKPAGMYVGSIETHNMNFVKHYKCRITGTGEICYIGDQYGKPDGKIYLDHASKADPTMHVVKFEREDAKPVVVVNFRAHPHFDGGYKKYDLSSDYIGAFRKALEAMVNCHCVYFQGACGNINASSRLYAERRFTTSDSYGLGLAGYACECLAKYMVETPAGLIKTAQQTYYGEINHTLEHLVKEATEIRRVWDTTFDRAKCDEMSLPLGIHSPYHAGAIRNNATFTKEEHGGMILNAVSIGDSLAFTTFPGELFDTLSSRMEDSSPFKTTMMLGYCYHHIGYLPSRAAYRYGCYETDITRFAPGVGEGVADTQVQMLRELKNG